MRRKLALHERFFVIMANDLATQTSFCSKMYGGRNIGDVSASNCATPIACLYFTEPFTILPWPFIWDKWSGNQCFRLIRKLCTPGLNRLIHLSGYCIVPHEMKMFNLTCYPEYSSDIRENRHFTERWHPIRPTKFSEPTEQPEATTAFLRSVHRSRLAKRQHGKSSKISSLLPTTRPSTTAEQQRPNGNSSLINATSTTSSPVNGTEIRDATSKDPGAFWTGTVRPLPVVDPETPKPDKKKENLWCPSCPWSYTTAEELFMPPTYLGKLATYDGGGYAIAVRADDDDTAHVLQLQKLGNDRTIAARKSFRVYGCADQVACKQLSGFL